MSNVIEKQINGQLLGSLSLNTIHQRDCVAGMKDLPDSCIDIAIADPPYNASKGNNWAWNNAIKLPGFGGNWSKVMANWDDMPLADYVTFTIAWLSELRRVVKPKGSIWIHGTYHNIGIINFALQMLQIEIINEIIWYKRNSFPNLSGRRLTASHETILWAHTGGKQRDYTFNYEWSKQFSSQEDNIKLPGKQMRTVWDVPNNKKKSELAFGKHPTQKPIRLIKRMLMLSCQPTTIVLSPFSGGGSECVAAKELGLKYIGFEVEQEFIDIANRRLQAATVDLDLFDESLTTPVVDEQKSKKAATIKTSNKAIPSLIKWTGSKRSQAYSIAGVVPSHRRYIEPFLGGGALLYLFANKNSLAGDIYAPLIKFWKLVQSDPSAVILNYRSQWKKLQEDLPGHFYNVRDRFNKTRDPLDLGFLMRTCVNGIVRFNDKGEFNNSFHLSRKGMHPDRIVKIVEKWTVAIKNVTFLCQDFKESIAVAKAGDFVYFDPPYAGNKQRYTLDLDCSEFFVQLEDLNRRDVLWALSFDGSRGNKDLRYDVPKDVYKQHLTFHSGKSAVAKVLNGPIEDVFESLYLNF